MGVIIALTILVSWAVHLIYILLGLDPDYASPWWQLYRLKS